MRDVLVIGGGPAGAQAAVSAATEGLTTVLAEPGPIGGQIAQTPHLENMVGYPYGITGSTFGRAMEDQLYRLGVKLIHDRVEDVTPRGHNGSRTYVVKIGGTEYEFRAVIVATGKRFKDLPVTGMGHPEVKYGPSEVFRFDAEGLDVVVVGGGNSAGQAIVHLGDRARKVHVIAPRLQTSQYLTDRIRSKPDTIELTLGARLVEIGRSGPDDLQVTAQIGNDSTTVSACRVFVCAGVTPNTDFLDMDLCEMDDDGLIITGPDYTTVQPGLFAIGDVRAGAINRVPSAIGEGSNVQPALWSYLKGE